MKRTSLTIEWLDTELQSFDPGKRTVITSTPAYRALLEAMKAVLQLGPESVQDIAFVHMQAREAFAKSFEEHQK